MAVDIRVYILYNTFLSDKKVEEPKIGGNVFPGKTRRYNADEYHALVPTVLSIVNTFATKAEAIKAFSTKPSFGDMDVLFIPARELSTKLLQEAFGCGFDEVSHNGGVWSLVFRELQIDLITTTTTEFAVSSNYFQYNDFGNFRGRIHHKLGLKFGHDGLWFPVRSKDHTLGEILLSTDPVEIDKFGDFTYGELNTLEEIFEAVAASKYFNPDIFLLENRNHTARVRDRKRATYTALLEWCKTQTVKTEFYQFDPDKTVYHRKIFKAFPHAKAEFDELWRRKFEIEEAAKKFNGVLVRELTGREDTRLGQLMKLLKVELTPTVVNAMTEDDIHSVIMEQHNKLKEAENAS